jgi:CubicO group peptidase (beta-lactamase class C family)
VLWNFGIADPETQTAVTDATMFRAGSITKSFAGIAMLILVERGMGRLDDRLSDLAPELPIRNPWHATHPVRLSNLLEAGAGFVGNQGSCDDVPGCSEALMGCTDPDIELKRFIQGLPFRLDVQWRPSEYTAYHNIGPTITAYVLEKITGERYEAFVQKNILDPLGMARSSFYRRETVAKTLALPAASGGDAGRDVRAYRHIPIRPSGALNSSAQELTRFVRLLLGRGVVDGRRLLRSESVELFETPTSTLAARKLGVRFGHGINNWTTHYRGVRYHGHGGQLVGSYTAYYAYAPEQGSGFVYMGTAGTGGVASVSAVTEEILAFFHPAVEAPSKAVITAEERSALPGCYVLANPTALEQRLSRYRVQAEGDLLALAKEGPGPHPILGAEASRILDRAPHPRMFRLRGGRRTRPGTTDVACVTNDAGQLVMQFLDAPHEAFEHVDCRVSSRSDAR